MKFSTLVLALAAGTAAAFAPLASQPRRLTTAVSRPKASTNVVSMVTLVNGRSRGFTFDSDSNIAGGEQSIKNSLAMQRMQGPNQLAYQGYDHPGTYSNRMRGYNGYNNNNQGYNRGLRRYNDFDYDQGRYNDYDQGRGYNRFNNNRRMSGQMMRGYNDYDQGMGYGPMRSGYGMNNYRRMNRRFNTNNRRMMRGMMNYDMYDQGMGPYNNQYRQGGMYNQYRQGGMGYNQYNNRRGYGQGYGQGYNNNAYYNRRMSGQMRGGYNQMRGNGYNNRNDYNRYDYNRRGFDNDMLYQGGNMYNQGMGPYRSGYNMRSREVGLGSYGYGRDQGGGYGGSYGYNQGGGYGGSYGYNQGVRL